MDEDEFESPPVPITHLRDSLGFFYQHVRETDRPVVIQRYNEKAVVMVPLWEWQWLKEVEDKVRRGVPITSETD